LELALDLHSHSVFAGGTQSLKISPETISSNRKKALEHLTKITETMPLKGIDVIGTGDSQFTQWTEILKSELTEEKSGIYIFQGSSTPAFMLQTELIFTSPIGKRSKIVHVVFLFPDFSTIDSLNDLLEKWEVKQKKMARPFIKCGDPGEVGKRINSILDIDSLIDAIPAHIMTPQGVFGSNIRINKLDKFFGTASPRLKIFETGLSADPVFLGLIPELDDKILISNSDAHSSSLHRMGREFTVISCHDRTYSSILDSLRKGKIVFTAEFPPEEGRFFLTGHRGGRKKPGLHHENEYCFFSPQHVPDNDRCPICHKSLTIGVFQRCVEIGRAQGAHRNLIDVKPKQHFIHMVPLIDILSHILIIKTKTSKSIISHYQKIVEILGPESHLWQISSAEIRSKLEGVISEPILSAILEVKAGNFTFKPYGYDGEYGSLEIGQRGNYKDVKVINSSRSNKALTEFLK